MHSLLENYLAEVQVKLSPLPEKRREEEMREMQQHLLNAVSVNQELGQTVDEAAATALIQFGSVEEASESIRWAWNRDTRKARVKVFGINAGIWTVSVVYICFQYPPQYRVDWVNTWVIGLVMWGLMFGFCEAVQHLPLAGETLLRAPAWLNRRMRTSPNRNLPPSP